jgi:hypothetical protein
MKRAFLFFVISILVAGATGCGSSFPSSSPPPSLSGAVGEPDGPIEAEPEETDPPGVWIDVQDYEKNGFENEDIQYNLLSENVAAEEYAVEFVKENSSQIRIDGWEYYFDTERAVLEGDDYSQVYEFLLCRKNGAGKTESLNIYGSRIEAGRGCLFLYNNQWNGPEADFWDTWVLSPEGKKLAYLGNIYDLFIPEQGQYLYFSDSLDLVMYRMDFSCEHLERLAISLPNDEILAKEIPDPYFSNIAFDRIEGDWLYFTGDIDSFFEKRFVGGYKMRVDGGAVYQTDDGIWYDYSGYDDAEAMDESPETEAPESTPGEWVPDTRYGVNGEGFIRNNQYEWISAGVPAINPDNAEMDEAFEVKVKAGGWEYFFDTANPVIYDGSQYGYPVLRKDPAGKVEKLGIDGFEIVATPQYLYVLNNWQFVDMVHWDTWRVSPDGKEKRYVGDALELFVPAQGGYLYFSGHDYCIFRTDSSFEEVESIALDTPDIGEIEQTVEPGTVFITYDKIEDGWLYFKMDAFNIDDGREYIGGYRMLLSGGKAYNTDAGAYSAELPFDEEEYGE